MRISDGVQTCALPILGENWSPLRAEFQHSAPGDYRIHRQLFRCPLEYGAERSAVVVSRDDIRRPTPHGNAHLLAFLEQHLESVRRAMPVDFVGQVDQIIAANLASGAGRRPRTPNPPPG